MKYRVYLRAVASVSVVVEAEDEEAAVEAAYDGELPTLCAQCSGWGQDWELELADDWEPEKEAAERIEDVS